MIKQLNLVNFRNYQNQRINFDSGINVLVGENGQGKTNILEAIYFLAFLRSFRTSSISSIKKIGTKGFCLSGELLTEAKWNKLIEIEYTGKRSLKIDNIPVYKSSDFVRQIKPVVFTHDDIKLISDTSGTRRKFIDILLSANDKNYLLTLQKYIIALRSRNAVLRSEKVDFSIIAAFEPLLAKYAADIILTRFKTLKTISEKADRILKTIKGEKFSLEIKYFSKIKLEDVNSEHILELFQKERERDIKRKYTGSGPHTDDIELIFNNKNLKNYGSLGQCRLAVLCLKMAELEILIEKNKNDKVIALVDDVTGELDKKTKESFFKILNKVNQTFFTFTHFDRDEEYFKMSSIYQISNGSVIS